MSVSFLRERQVAVEAVTAAAALCARVRAEMVGAQYEAKQDQSPVTTADYGSQALVCQRLATTFPDDAVVAEEQSEALRRPENAASLDLVTRYVRQDLPAATPGDVCDWIDWGASRPGGRFWTLDPIDGTKGFLRNDQYAVALALIENGEVKLGALACPALSLDPHELGGGAGVLFVAVRGAGAVWAPLGGGQARPLGAEPAGARRRLVESVEARHGDHGLQETIARALGLEPPALRMDSQAKYGAVARGDAVLYLRLPSPASSDYREAIWDHAAGAIIVEEAGGRVTDALGEALDFSAGARLQRNRGVVVSRGVGHAAVLTALEGAL